MKVLGTPGKPLTDDSSILNLSKQLNEKKTKKKAWLKKKNEKKLNNTPRTNL